MAWTRAQYNAWRRKRRADPAFRRRELDEQNAKRRNERITNPAKARARDKRAYAKHKHRWRDRSLRRNYNLTLSEWNMLWAAQGFRCAICKSTESGDRRHDTFATDHDHKTGIVRGILCHHCNKAVGYVFDDPNRCRAIAKYLEERSGGPSAGK